MRWPIIGCDMAAKISGDTVTGPGMNSFLAIRKISVN
jgi:hypothetical protein